MWTPTALEKFLSLASITPEIASLRPDYRVLLITLSGISNGPSSSDSDALLSEAETSIRSKSSNTAVTDLPHIAAWRETYKAFGAKPAKYRNSLEALTRRITPDKGLPRVNRLTDIYNAISVKYQIPLGVEDLDKYTGSPILKRASGGEKFETKDGGKEVIENPEKGEVVWCDDSGVTCRRWNWRQGTRTALTDETTSVVIIADALEPFSDEELDKVGDELIKELSKGFPDVCVARRVIRA